MDLIGDFGVIPLNYDSLSSFLGNYKSSKDKIVSLEQKGDIIRVKKGLYVVNPILLNKPLCKELIANHIYQQSYVSFETALGYYGLIPERVYTIKSASIKRTKSFSNKIGNFEYIQINQEYFSIGVRSEIINNNYAFLIACPEKALCDLIITSKTLRIQSIKSMQEYLFKDLRIDSDEFNKLKPEIIKECIEKTIKKRKELELVYKILRDESI